MVDDWKIACVAWCLYSGLVGLLSLAGLASGYERKPLNASCGGEELHGQ